MSTLAQLFGTYNQVEIRWNKNLDNPVWVAKDVCDVLEIKNNRDALTSLDSDEKDVVKADTPGGTQELAGVTEPGLYRLIFKSRKDGAKAFQRWVFHEVLPQIRKTGGYQKPVVDLNNPPELIAARQCVEIYQNLENFNPRLAQLFTDKLANRVVYGENTLPEADRLMGVVEIAEEMGLKVPPNFASSLGRYVSQRCESVAKVEKRLVNGRWCDTKLYPIGNEYVKGAIVEYLRAKEIA